MLWCWAEGSLIFGINCLIYVTVLVSGVSEVWYLEFLILVLRVLGLPKLVDAQGVF